MDDVKDKFKGFMKKVSSSTGSSSGRFKGQGRVLGSSSSSSSASNLSERYNTPTANKNLPQRANNSNANNNLPQKPNPNTSSDNQVVEKKTNFEVKPKSTNEFDPYDSLITSNKRNANGYELKVFECPICNGGFPSEEEVSEHVEICLNSSEAKITTNMENLNVDESEVIMKSELEVCVNGYLSGKPSDGSIEVVTKLLKNIGKEPENAKFRKIRMGNPKIREAISDVPGGVELLEFIGFELKEEGDEIFAVMEVPSKEQVTLIKNLVLLLEPKKVEDLPIVPVKLDKPIEPKKIDRQMRVFFSVSESVAAKIDLPDTFFNLTREEVKRDADMRKKRLEESNLLIPKSYREKQAKAAKKKHSKTIIRVQFPDGVVLQGVFLPSEPTTSLYQFVSSALKAESLEFELLHPVVIKRRVIPNFSDEGKKVVTLEDEDLVPSALIKFRPIENDSVVFTGLRNELLVISEPLT